MFTAQLMFTAHRFRTRGAWRSWLLIAVAAIGGALHVRPLAAQPGAPQAVAAQRAQRNQPLLQMKADFPLSRVHRLKFAKDPVANQLWLFAAGDDKQVFRWKVLQSGGQYALESEETIHWPIYRDIRGTIKGLAVRFDKSGQGLAAFGGVGVKIPQVQLVNPAKPQSQLMLLYNDGKTAILSRQQVNDLDFSPGGSLLAVAYGGEKRLVVWDVSKGAATAPTLPSKRSHALKTNLEVVHGVSFDSSGRRLAVRGVQAGNWQVEEWNLAQAEAPKLASTEQVGAVDEVHVDVAWVKSNSAERWITAVGSTLTSTGNVQAANNFPVVSLAATDDGQQLALLGDGKLSLSNVAGGRAQAFSAVPSQATAVAISPDGALIAAAGFEQADGVWTYQIKLWEANGQQPVVAIPASTAATAGGASIARVGFVEGTKNDTIAFAWGDPGTNRPFSKKFQLIGRSAVKAFDSQKDKATGSKHDVAVIREGKIWYANAGTETWGPLPLLDSKGPRCGATSGPLLALGYDEGILVCDLEGIKRVGPAVRTITEPVRLAFEAKKLADKTVLRAFYGHAGGVDCLGWAPQGGWLVSGSRDGTIMGWSLSGLGTHGLDLAVHPNGQLLFVKSEPAANTPAKAAKFRANDFIRAVSDNNVRTNKEEHPETAALLPALRQAITGAIPGSNLTVEIEALGPDQKTFVPAKRELTVGLRRDGFNPLGLNLVINNGQLFVAADPSPAAPAWAAGFQRGQRITGMAVNGKEVKGEAAMKQAIETAVPGTELYIVSKTNNVFVDHLTRVMHEAIWILYPQQDGNWWLSTPNSRFDASRDCLDRLEMHTNADSPLTMDRPAIVTTPWTWPGNVFFNLLNDPGSRKILDRAIRLRQPEPELDLIAPPQFKLAVGANNDVVLSATPVEGKVTEVSVWLNSRRLAAKSGTEIAAKIDPRFLRRGENTLTGVAIVDPGPGKPAVARSTVRVLDQSRPGQGQPKLHFLGVGVTNFQDATINAQLAKNPGGGNLTPLQFADRDVDEIGAALAAALGAGGGPGAAAPAFASGDFTVLTANTKAPTEANIDAAFANLAKSANSDDLAIVIFAGHGLGDDKNPFKFLAQDTAKIDTNVGLTHRKLEDLLGTLPCRTLLLLDACHSGAAQAQQRLANWPGLDLGPNVLPACRNDQVSLESSRYEHGLFSQAILEAVTGVRARTGKGAKPPPLPVWDKNADGLLSVGELCDYVAVRTPRLCEEMTGKVHNPELRRSVTFRDIDTVQLFAAPQQPAAPPQPKEDD